MSFTGMTEEGAKKYKESGAEHVIPTYYAYEGGFDSTTKCSSCGRIGLYEDQLTMKPCPKCGGEVLVDMARIWNIEKQKWFTRSEHAKYVLDLADVVLKEHTSATKERPRCWFNSQNITVVLVIAVIWLLVR